MIHKLVTILGPTAVGKTKLAAKLAFLFNGEIISADSRQVYEGMDIGTGKDLDDYFIEGTLIPYHLVDVISPLEEFDLYKFQNLFYQAFSNITSKKKLPFLVGGTGLYISSILNNYNLSSIDFNGNRYHELKQLPNCKLIEILKALKPNLHNTTDLLDNERIIKAILIAEGSKSNLPSRAEIESLVIGVTEERDVIKKRITTRLKKRIEEGMIEEVETLINNGVTHQKLKFFGLEYKFISLYLKGEINKNDMFQKLNSAIHKFAKRQMTWYRKMEREGIEINWIRYDEHDKAEKLISTFIK